MGNPSQQQFNLKDILKSLNRDDLDNFKCVLKNMSLPRTLKQIPQIILDMADGVHLAEILHEYCPSGWVETVTMEIFQMINREDLADLVMEQLKGKQRPFHTVSYKRRIILKFLNM